MAKAKIITPEFRLSFPSIWEPKAGPDGGEPKYRIVMLFPKTADLTQLKKMAWDAATEKWGPDRAKWPQNLRFIDPKSFLSNTGRDGWPFRNGDAQELEGYAGMVSVSASSKQAPGVVDRRRNEIIEKDEVYAGCYCRASLTAFAYDKSGNRGVSFGLMNIQKVRDGEPFSGRTKATDDFDDLGEDTGGEFAATGTDGAADDMWS